MFMMGGVESNNPKSDPTIVQPVPKVFRFFDFLISDSVSIGFLDDFPTETLSEIEKRKFN